MIARKTFLYFLTETSSGKSYYVDNGTVTTTNIPTPLPQSPGGWIENEVKFSRNSKYYGINRTFTTPLKFVGDGATIIRNQYYTAKGVECPITLIILKWDDNKGTFEMYYKGELDLFKIQDNSADSVTVNLLEGGLVKLIKSNENTVYEIPCDGSIPENFQVKIHGVLFQDTFTYQINEYNAAGSTAALSVAFISNTGDNIGIEKGSQTWEQFNAGAAAYAASSKNYFFSSQGATTLTISGVINLMVTSTSNLKIGFITSRGTIVYAINQNGVAPGQVNQNFSVTVNLLAGDNLFLITNGTSAENILQSFFTVQFNSQLKDTNTWAVSARDLFKLIINKIGDSKYQTQSSLLDQYLNFAITSGRALRGDDKAVIKTTLSELFDSVNSILNASLGTISTVGQNDVIFLENKGYVFDSSVVTLDLGEVSDLKIEVASDHFFNTMKIGYEPQTYDEKAGQNEYNTTAQWKFPITRIVKELQLISKYRADSFGVESTRINYGGKSTTNNASDNATFILNIDRTSSTPKQYVGAKNTSELINVTEVDVVYNTFTPGPDLIPNSFNNSVFVYSGATVAASFTISTNDASHGSKKISIRQNGVDMAFMFAPSFGQSNTITASLILKAGDQISTHIIQQGLDSSFTINSANITVTFPNAAAFLLKRVTYDVASGMPNISSAYNIEDLTPKRMLLKHGNYLKSSLFNLQPAQLIFQTADKNPLLSTSVGGVTITENANVPIASLADPLFYPVMFNFKTKVPLNFTDIMSAAANGHIKFTFNGKTFYGFPQDVAQKPSLEESQTWKLLASPLINLADLQNLEVDGLNYIDLMGLSLFVPHLCPVKLVPLNTVFPAQYHFKNMDSDWFMEQIKEWSDQNPYFQPWQTNDAIHLQVQTNGLGPVSAQLIDYKGTVIGTYLLSQITNAAIISPITLFEGVVPLTGLIDNTYYIHLTAGTGGTIAEFISEPLYVRADHPGTLLFEYSNIKNKQSTIFTTGYNPSIRVHGFLESFSPESNFSTYEDEPADLEVLAGIPFRKYKLTLGSDQGLPDWVVDKMNRVMLLNNVTIDGNGFTRNSDAKFEPQRTPGQPRAYWSIDIRESENKDGVTLSTDGTLDQSLTDIYNVNTKGFGDGAGSNNIVQITTID